MSEFVSQHTGELGLAVGECHQASGDVDIAARRRESVDDIGVQDREGVSEVLALDRPRQELADAIDVFPEPR